MKKAPGKIIALALVLGCTAFFAYLLVRERPVSVTVAAVESGIVERTVSNTRAGSVKAQRRARLAPALGGQIVRLPVREGDRVEKGAVLLELSNEDLAADVLLAEKETESARATAHEICTRAESARTEIRRRADLARRGLVSRENYDVLAADAEAKRAACEASLARAGVMEAKTERARALFDKTILRAPFAGTVAEVNGEIGEFLTPSPVGIPTLPAVDLIDLGSLYVSAPIDEVDAGEVHPGMEARITLDAFRDRIFPGRVRRIAPYVLEVEKQARTVEIEAEFFPEAEIAGLLAGYSADVEILIGTRNNVLRIPTGAIIGGTRVLVLGSDEILEERHIKTGLSNWSFTEVTAGLAQGELVVTSPDREGVRPGVKAVPEETTRR